MELKFDESDLAREKSAYYLQLEYGAILNPADVRCVEWVSAGKFIIRLVDGRTIPGASSFGAHFMKHGRRGSTGGWLVG